ncbi:hypothetical protein AB0D71_10445 [Streptomyces avermitilis]
MIVARLLVGADDRAACRLPLAASLARSLTIVETLAREMPARPVNSAL